MMRLCIETSSLNTRFAGIAYYAWFLARNLVEQPGDIELSGFDGINFHPITAATLDEARARNEAGSQSPQQLVARDALHGFARNIPLARRAYRALKDHRFKRNIHRVDLFHAVNYIAPSLGFSRVLPLIHDVSHERHPETHPQERIDWLRRGLQGLDRYPIINTVSEFSAGEIAEFYAVAPERIRVTYPGVNPIYSPQDDEGDRLVLEEFGLHHRAFFIAVGTLEPRKNLQTVLKAFRKLPRDTRIAHPLVLIGQPGWGDDGLSQTKDLLAEGSMRILGYQSDRHLAALYRSARTVLFSSIYEGFGIPTAEALRSGKRPILSDIPVMREIGGEAADYVKPLDADGWAEALNTAIHDSRHEDDGAFRTAGVERARRYDWPDNARRTAELYREVEKALK